LVFKLPYIYTGTVSANYEVDIQFTQS